MYIPVNFYDTYYWKFFGLNFTFNIPDEHDSHVIVTRELSITKRYSCHFGLLGDQSVRVEYIYYTYSFFKTKQNNHVITVLLGFLV